MLPEQKINQEAFKTIERITKSVLSNKINPDKLISDADSLLQLAGDDGRELVKPLLKTAVKQVPEGIMQTSLINRLTRLRQQDLKTHDQAPHIRRLIQLGEDLEVSGKPEGQLFIDALKKEYQTDQVTSSVPQIPLAADKVMQEAQLRPVRGGNRLWNRVTDGVRYVLPHREQKGSSIADLTKQIGNITSEEEFYRVAEMFDSLGDKPKECTDSMKAVALQHPDWLKEWLEIKTEISKIVQKIREQPEDDLIYNHLNNLEQILKLPEEFSFATIVEVGSQVNRAKYSIFWPIKIAMGEPFSLEPNIEGVRELLSTAPKPVLQAFDKVVEIYNNPKKYRRGALGKAEQEFDRLISQAAGIDPAWQKIAEQKSNSINESRIKIKRLLREGNMSSGKFIGQLRQNILERNKLCLQESDYLRQIYSQLDDYYKRLAGDRMEFIYDDGYMAGLERKHIERVPASTLAQEAEPVISTPIPSGEYQFTPETKTAIRKIIEEYRRTREWSREKESALEELLGIPEKFRSARLSQVQAETLKEQRRKLEPQYLLTSVDKGVLLREFFQAAPQSVQNVFHELSELCEQNLNAASNIELGNQIQDKQLELEREIDKVKGRDPDWIKVYRQNSEKSNEHYQRAGELLRSEDLSTEDYFILLRQSFMENNRLLIQDERMLVEEYKFLADYYIELAGDRFEIIPGVGWRPADIKRKEEVIQRPADEPIQAAEGQVHGMLTQAEVDAILSALDGYPEEKAAEAELADIPDDVVLYMSKQIEELRVEYPDLTDQEIIDQVILPDYVKRLDDLKKGEV